MDVSVCVYVMLKAEPLRKYLKVKIWHLTVVLVIRFDVISNF